MSNPEPYSSDWIAEKIAAFEAKGGEIKILPSCAFSVDAEPMSTIRRKIEKLRILAIYTGLDGIERNRRQSKH